MNKFLFTAAALAAAAGLSAQDPKSSYSVTADFAYASEYVFRGLEQSDAALQPAVTVTIDKLQLGVWSSQALSNQSEAWAHGNEVDVWGSYGIPVGSATVTLGGTAYLYPSARASLGEPDNTWELSAGISAPLGPVTGSATYFHDFVLDADTFQFGLVHSWALPDDKGAFDLGATYGFNDIQDGNGDLPGTGGVDYRYWSFNATLSYKLTNTTTAKLGAVYTGVNKIAGAPKNLLFTVGVTAGL